MLKLGNPISASSWGEDCFVTRRKKEIMDNEGQLAIFTLF